MKESKVRSTFVQAAVDSSPRSTLWLTRTRFIASNPAQLQLEFALWNRRAVMLAIKSLFGIDMPIRTDGEYLRRWCLTPQRPVKRALERDPARLKAWLSVGTQ